MIVQSVASSACFAAVVSIAYEATVYIASEAGSRVYHIPRLASGTVIVARAVRAVVHIAMHTIVLVN